MNKLLKTLQTKYSKKGSEIILLKLRTKFNNDYLKIEKEVLKKSKKIDKKQLTKRNFIESQNNLFNGKVNRNITYGVPGVYFLFRGDEILYIGESVCITTRISEHHRNMIIDFDSFLIFQIIENETERKKLEKTLIIKHAPVCNLIHNKSLTTK